jgi:lipocalin-like protein
MRSDQVSGRWVHAHEEDTENEMVFRPAGTDLPPSRGRMAFELRADGTFTETGLGATDVPEEATGTWVVEGDTITLSEGAAQGVPREMEVATADEERLVIRKRRGGR